LAILLPVKKKLIYGQSPTRLVILLVCVAATLILAYANYDPEHSKLNSFLLALLGAILTLTIQILFQIADRNKQDSLLTQARSNTKKNTRIVKFIEIIDSLKESDTYIKKALDQELESVLKGLKRSLDQKEFTSENCKLLKELYSDHQGNIYVVSDNDTCKNWWETQDGNEIHVQNCERQINTIWSQAVRTFKGKKLCEFERIFVGGDDCSIKGGRFVGEGDDPKLKSIEKIIEFQEHSGIKCFRTIKSQTTGHYRPDFVIFEGLAVCETKFVEGDDQPYKYQWHFHPNKIKNFHEAYENIKGRIPNKTHLE